MRLIKIIMLMLITVMSTTIAQSSVDCSQTRNRLIEVEGCGWQVYEEDICVHWEQDGLGNWYIFNITGEHQSQWSLVSDCIRTQPDQDQYNIAYLLEQEELLNLEITCENSDEFDESVPCDPETLRSCFYLTCTHTNSQTGMVHQTTSKYCSPIPD